MVKSDKHHTVNLKPKSVDTHTKNFCKMAQNMHNILLTDDAHVKTGKVTL